MSRFSKTSASLGATTCLSPSLCLPKPSLTSQTEFCSTSSTTCRMTVPSWMHRTNWLRGGGLMSMKRWGGSSRRAIGSVDSILRAGRKKHWFEQSEEDRPKGWRKRLGKKLDKAIESRLVQRVLFVCQVALHNHQPDWPIPTQKESSALKGQHSF